MYLMNVPPVAVTQAEWRTCGPPGGYSLPCFHDSDTELSTRGTPISDKVQMIIQSLRSSQSSLEMGDELEGNVLSGQEGHPQVCKLPMGSFVGAKSKSKGPAESQQTGASLPINRESSDSDSDGSVDRGIEEAIMEYLKEKGDSKQKADPCSTFLQKETTAEDNPHGNPFLIATSQYPRIVKVESLARPAAVPIKKYIKNKASINDGTLKTFDSDKGAMIRNLPVRVKEEQSEDSSSDDGIEEAIQRYQLEKREQENRREPLNPCAIKEESDSTSDDGIEEAICRYQLEQLEEKNVLQTFTHKTNLCSKALIHAIGSTSMGSMKKLKQTKKTREVKPLPPSALKNPLLENQKGKGNGLLSFKVDCVRDQPAPVPSKVNTTAELMCAEAILDISKTVMPEVFHHGVGLGGCAVTKSPLQIDTCPDEDSDDSSVDSEDGIEQEIRKFLEQKAQMHKEPPASAETQEPQRVKQVTTQRKLSRLSLTQRRKNKEENGCNPNMSGMDNTVEVMPSESLLEHKKDLSPDRSQAHLRKMEQSGDKSSSLDSDEDLDTAIKDLLKTKKKSKKKTRDLKRKSRKCLKDEGPPLTNATQTKKFKPDPFSKRSTLKKVQKIDDDVKAGLSKKNIIQHKQADTSSKASVREGEVEIVTGGEDSLHIAHTPLEMEDDSSSVDSDDSIEQEIRRFLAEKAKGSTSLKIKDVEEPRNGSICGLFRDEDIKQESQLAEISTISTSTTANPFSGQSNLPQDRPSAPTPQSLAPGIFGAQPRLSSIPSCSPSVMEPADGARTERRSNTSGDQSQPARVKPALSPSASAHSRSEAIKWRQSFGLPITDTRTLSRLPFHITSSKINETPSPTLPHQSRGAHHALGSAWSSTKTSGVSFPWTTGRTPTSKSPVMNLLSSPRQHPPRLSFTQGPAPGRSSPSSPMEGERQSMVHIPKDKSVFVELESNRTNHVQVRSKERSVGKKEGGSLLIEIKKEGEALEIGDGERTQEEFIDEAECEADDRRDPGKQQGFSTLSLSSAIDPGITIRPCIALTTEERSRMFSRKYLPENCSKKGKPLVSTPLQYKTLQEVKRKLQFVPMDRRRLQNQDNTMTA